MYSSRFREFIITAQLMIITVAIGGNLLVCCAVLLNKQMRMSPTSFFIFSLAVADILTASFPMPFEVDIMLKKGRWTHGETLCTVYTTMYLIAAPSSVMNLVAVSVDRYLALSRPLQYKHGRLMTMTKALIIIVVIWLYTILTALLPVMGWNYHDGPALRNETCGFNIAYSYSISSSFVNFVFPLIVTCILNALIYRISCTHMRLRGNSVRSSNFRKKTTKVVPLKHETKHLNKFKQNFSQMGPVCDHATFARETSKSFLQETGFKIDPKGAFNEQTVEEFGTLESEEDSRTADETKKAKRLERRLSCLRDKDKGIVDCDYRCETNASCEPTEEKEKEPPSMTVVNSKGNSTSESKVQPDTIKAKSNNDLLPETDETSTFESSGQRFDGTQTSEACGHPETLRTRLSSDGLVNVKAAKTIILIVSCFTVCWVPHTMLSLVGSLCVHCARKIQPEWFQTLLLLAYTNSCCNPFIYAFQRRDFRKTFKRILSIKEARKLFQGL